MKKLILLLFIPFLSFGQGDFRKMNWGDSVEDLEKSYPKINFTEGDYDKYGIQVVAHTGKLSEIDVSITYRFYNDSLIAGDYFFKPRKILEPYDKRLKDFSKIEEILLEKYPFIEKDYYTPGPKWTVINNEELNYRYMELQVDDEGNPVDVVKQRYKTRIVHMVFKESSSSSYPMHMLGFGSKRYLEIINEYKEKKRKGL